MRIDTKLLRWKVENILWKVKNRVRKFLRRFLFELWLFASETEFRSFNGRRFLELQYLLRRFLLERVRSDRDLARDVASQFENVLHSCDTITYEDPGTAEAYALLHFLDRYHRFQIIFEELKAQKLMPMRRQKIDVLDVGTGPGPSMYALSDFYTYLKIKQILNSEVNIDYVERSREFRHWLHIFTEYVNFYSPSGVLWKVPYHHGSFFDFGELEFNQELQDCWRDDDGDWRCDKYVKKFRFDMVVLSNFLTTEEQVERFSESLKDSIRYLRNKGILVVVGAKSSIPKYQKVYAKLSDIICSENYNNWKFIASCEEVKLEKPQMSYSWGDNYGKKLKEVVREVYKEIEEFVPINMKKVIQKTIHPLYNKPIEWEVHVFRKNARIRKKKRKKK